MKRFIALMLIVALLAPALFASTPLPAYTPYEEGEFPLWTYKLHRAERIFFGSMIITMPLSILALSLAEQGGLITAPTNDVKALLRYTALASGLSLGVALTDFIIGEMQSR